MKNFEQALTIIDKARVLGERRLENGTQLIGHIPHRGPQAYFHTVFPPLSSEGMEKIEQTIGTSLPEQYKEFLTHTNGLHLFGGEFSLDGLRRNYVRIGDEAVQPFDLHLTNTFERPKDAANDWVFIGGYRLDGSNLYIDKLTGKVYRSERRKATNRLNEWPDFWTMLVSEMERLAALFDERGRRIDPLKPKIS